MYKQFKLLLLSCTLVPLYAHSELDPCQSQYTLMHYAQSTCFNIERPLKNDKSFHLRAALISKDLKQSAKKETIVVIPGGPGESSGPLRGALQEKEILNTIWSELDKNIILFDPRGTGKSEFPDDITNYGSETFSTDIFVEDLKTIIDAIRPNSKVILMAHSAGASVALGIARRFPQKVSKMILISGSPGVRFMALDNIQTYRLSRPDFVTNSISDQSLLAKYDYIENALAQQYKARIHNTLINQEFSDNVLRTGFRDPQDLRNVMLKTIETQHRKGIEERIEKIYEMIRNVDTQENPVVTPELSSLAFSNEPIIDERHSPKEWIQKIIMCEEGTKAEELTVPLFYHGRTMNYYCNGRFSTQALSEDLSWLNQIQIPTLIVGGDKDIQVPFSLQKRTAENLPNSTLIMVKNGGHMFFTTKPVELFKALFKFLE